LGHDISRLMMEPGAVRDRLTGGIYVPAAAGESMADLEEALKYAIECAPIETRIRGAVKSGQITAQGREQITQAYHLNVINAAEAEAMKKLHDLRSRVIKVDDFSRDFSSSDQMELAETDSRSALSGVVYTETL